jgi:hypothetical protein
MLMGERIRNLWAQFGIGVIVVLLSTVAMLGMLGWRAQPGFVVAVAAPRAATLLTNFYEPEKASDGVYSRWTAGTAMITIANRPWQQMTQVQFTIADSARAVTTTIQVGQLRLSVPMANATRIVSLLLPHTDMSGRQYITLTTPVIQLAGDERALGIRMRQIAVLGQPWAWPAPLWWGLLGWLAIVGALLGILIAGARWAWLGAVIYRQVVLLAMMLSDMVNLGQWFPAWTGIAVLVPVGAWLVRRFAPLVLLRGWVVVLTLRLIGITYPTFSGHDYLIHLRRVFLFRDGSWTMAAHPYEFGRRQSLILPLYYRLADGMGSLLGYHLAMHLIIVLCETGLGLAVWALLRRSGVTPLLALFSGLVVLSLPISSAVLWWSFMQQITAHVFTVVIAYAVVRRDQRGAYLATTVLAGVALTHIGEAMIAAVWYGLLRLCESDRFSRVWWLRTLPVLGAVVLLIPIYASFFVNNVGHGQAGLINPDLANVWPRMQTAFMVGFAPFPWLAVVLLLAWAVRVAWRTTVPWLLTAGLFFAVELLDSSPGALHLYCCAIIGDGLCECVDPHLAQRLGWSCIGGVVYWFCGVDVDEFVGRCSIGVTKTTYRWSDPLTLCDSSVACGSTACDGGQRKGF